MTETTTYQPHPALLANNLAIIHNRWPDLHTLIGQAIEPEDAVIVDNGLEKTLHTQGIHLSSCYDRTKEAELQASLIPKDSIEAWVYGFGLGDLPRVLLQRTEIQQLFVVILNPGVTRLSLKYFNHTDWLSDPKVMLLTAAEEDDVHFPFAANPACLQLAEDSSARIRDIVHLELSTPYIRKQHQAANELLKERLVQNIGFVKTDGDVASLFNSKKNARIMVAAAGPTLEDHYEWIKQEQKNESSLLIAVDAALKPLVNVGILPDIVITIDSNNFISSFFSGFDLSHMSRTPLVYYPQVTGNALKLWTGPRLTAYADHILHEDLAQKFPRGQLFSSGSVAHPAIDLAVKMGAAQIILLGFDFAYPGGKINLAGTSFSTESGRGSKEYNCWVLDGESKRIETLPKLRGYLRDLERYIAKHPEIKFFNTSKKGAAIKGTKLLTRKEENIL